MYLICRQFGKTMFLLHVLLSLVTALLSCNICEFTALNLITGEHKNNFTLYFKVHAQTFGKTTITRVSRHTLTSDGYTVMIDAPSDRK